MNGKKFAQALDRDVRLALLNPPVLYTWQLKIVGKILMTAIPFFLTQIGKLSSDTSEGIT